jgi:phosphate starvation-inducible protein PhoH
MAEDKVKIQLEVPKEQIKVAADSPPSPSELVEKEKQLQQKETQLKHAEKKLEAKIEEKVEEKIKEKDEEPASPTIAGYKAEDILKAPIETPEPEDKRPPNSHQKKVITFGLGVIVAAIFIGPLLNFSMALALALAGAATVVFATFVRV